MQIIVVVEIDPFNDRHLQLIEGIPILKPTTFFFDGTHKAFGFRISFGIAKTGEYLPNARFTAVFHKSQTGRPTTVVAHQL